MRRGGGHSLIYIYIYIYIYCIIVSIFIFGVEAQYVDGFDSLEGNKAQ